MGMHESKEGRPTRQPIPVFLLWLAVPASASAVVGLAASYVAMRHYLDDLGWLSYLAPAVIELTIAYLAVSLVYRARKDGRWRPERALVYTGIGLAAYLNWAAYPQASTAARAWHAAMPLLWSIAIEWGNAWARHLLRLEQPPAEHVPLGVWITRPCFAVSVQRLMWLTGTRTYTEALTRHQHHALATAEHKGASAPELAGIRLRYAAVRPSAAALSAGDGPQGPAHDSAHQPASDAAQMRTGPAPRARTNTRAPATRRRGHGLPTGMSARQLSDEQIAALLTDAHGGPLPPAQMPSENAVMDRYAVSRPRAARVLALLRAHPDGAHESPAHEHSPRAHLAPVPGAQEAARDTGAAGTG
jgi:hypothetical protein